MKSSISRVCELAEPPHGDAANAVRALGILVLPRHIVAGARGQHLDVVPLGELFRHEATRVFGATENLCSVSLDDEGESHCWNQKADSTEASLC